MPVDPIFIDTTIQAYGLQVPAWGNVLVVGRDAGGTASDGVVEECANLAAVATLFGATSDIYYAAELVFAQGARKLWAMRYDKTDVAAEAVVAGSVQVLTNFPVQGDPELAMAATTIEYTAGVPTDPGAGKAMLNPLTGQIWLSGAAPVNADYSYVDWTVLADAVDDFDLNIVIVAGVDSSEQWYGEVDSMLDIADAQFWIMPVKSEAAETAANVVTQFANYTSKNFVAVASKALGANEDLNGAVAGLLSITEPWDKLMWKMLRSITPSAYFTKTDVENVLEVGKVNAIIDKQNADRMSDGLTTAGGDYKFVDTTRTQYWLQDKIIYGLTQLVMDTRVPYTPTGIQIVKATIEKACQDAVLRGALREPWVDADGTRNTGYIVQVPEFSDVSAADRIDRVLKDVYVTVYFAGHIQSITLNLAIQL